MKVIVILALFLSMSFSQQLVPTASRGVVDIMLSDMKGNSIGGEVVFFQNGSGEKFSGITDAYGKVQILAPGNETLTAYIETIVGPFQLGRIKYPRAPFKGNAQLQFENTTIPLNNVLFETGKANLKRSSSKELNKLVDGFKKNPALTVEIAGHTDNVGDDQYNLELSEKRAQAVVNYLLSKGVEASRLTGKGYGESQPIADNNSNSGKAKNRRIEMIIINQ